MWPFRKEPKLVWPSCKRHGIKMLALGSASSNRFYCHRCVLDGLPGAYGTWGEA